MRAVWIDGIIYVMATGQVGLTLATAHGANTTQPAAPQI